MAITPETQINPDFSNGLWLHGNSGLKERIAEAAYYKAEHRGFAQGHEVQDWLEAEQDVLCREGIIHCNKSTMDEEFRTAIQPSRAI